VPTSPLPPRPGPFLDAEGLRGLSRLLTLPSRPCPGHNPPVPAVAKEAAISSEVDRAERSIPLQRQIIAICTGDAPAADEQGRDRYFLLIAKLARLGEEAEKGAAQADGNSGATGAGDRTA